MWLITVVKKVVLGLLPLRLGIFYMKIGHVEREGLQFDAGGHFFFFFFFFLLSFSVFAPCSLDFQIIP
jgi:hypothetical protein